MNNNRKGNRPHTAGGRNNYKGSKNATVKRASFHGRSQGAKQNASQGGSKGGSRGGSRTGRSGGARGGNRGGRGGGRKMPTFNPSQFVNQNPVEIQEEVYKNRNGFTDFNLNPILQRTLKAMQITTPSPIQDQVIPEIMDGHDVIGLAETGTGKTAAFLLPLIEKTIADMGRKTLILTPTRELAIQIDDELTKLKKGFKLASTICVGGVNIRPQISSLKRCNHFVIGTPGRILDLINRKLLQTKDITTVILDEADRMLDMGFITDIRKILSTTPKDRETLFFSATMDERTKSIVNDFMKNPVTISVKKKDVTNSITQNVICHRETDKLNLLTDLFANADYKRVLIFGGTKHGVEKLSKQLNQAGVKAESIHGNKNHNQRQMALNNFKSGRSRILVATDVAARGIHVDNVSHVINYDLPQTFTDYVHRIGRTGRGDKKGCALTFVPERAQNRREGGRTGSAPRGKRY